MLLADQESTNLNLIDVPTLHVVGCSDPYILGAVALHNMCDQESAEIFDHGKGHTVPRDARTIVELGDAIDRLVERSESWKTASSEGYGSGGCGGEEAGANTVDAALHTVIQAVEF